MAKFKIIISYENSYFEELIEIDAETIKQAKIKCEEIKLENNNKIEFLKSKNIYSSKIIKECKLDKYDWSYEVLGCAIIENLNVVNELE